MNQFSLIFFFYLMFLLIVYNKHKKHTGHLLFYWVMMSDTHPTPKLWKTHYFMVIFLLTDLNSNKYDKINWLIKIKYKIILKYSFRHIYNSKHQIFTKILLIQKKSAYSQMSFHMLFEGKFFKNQIHVSRVCIFKIVMVS